MVRLYISSTSLSNLGTSNTKKPVPASVHPMMLGCTTFSMSNIFSIKDSFDLFGWPTKKMDSMLGGLAEGGSWPDPCTAKMGFFFRSPLFSGFPKTTAEARNHPALRMGSRAPSDPQLMLQ